MPGWCTCLMMYITAALNKMGTPAQELRPDGSVVTHMLTGGSFRDEWEHPETESPTQPPSPAEQNITVSYHFSTHQPLSTSVTGCVTRRINNPYLGCHLKRHLVPQFNQQVTTGGNFPVWTTPLKLTAADNTWNRLLLLFCCNLVVLSKCKVLLEE